MRKKIKWNIIVIILAAVILFLLLLYQLKKGTADTASLDAPDHVVLEENQEIILGQITKIAGNEITYMKMEETGDSTTPEEIQTKPETTPEERGVLPDGSSGKATGDSDTSAVRTLETAEGGYRTLPEGMPEEEKPAQEYKENRKKYQALEESETLLIPVGTEVITKLGAITTFSRLSTGDMVKLLIQKNEEDNVILKLWII